MKKCIKEYWQLAVTFFVITFAISIMCCSCSSAKEVEHVYHCDTVYSNSVVHDSVDRWHMHYEYIKGDTIHIIDTFYHDRWHIAHDTAYKTAVDVQNVEVEKIVEKKVYVLWPIWIVLGIAVLLGLWWLFEHTLNNLAKKEGEF